MKSLRKGLKVSTVTTLALGLIVGCSSTSTPTSTGTTSPAANTSSSSTAAAATKAPDGGEKVTIRFTDWANNEEAKSTRVSLDAFEKAHPNIKVDYQNVALAEFGAKLSAMAASKTLPDISTMLEAQALKYAESDILMDLSPYYKDGSVTPKLESNKFVTPDGKLLGYSVANEIILLHYNKTMFDEAKLPYPPAETEKAWTWDQMLEVAKKLTKDKNGKHPGETGFDTKNIVQYGINITHSQDFFWTPFAISNGGGEVSQDGKQLLLDKPETIEAIQKIADLSNVEHVSPTAAQSSGLPGDVGQLLLSKKVAMVTSGQWELVNINPQLKNGLKNGIGVLPIFKKPATTNTGTPMVVYKSTKHPKETIELYKWLMDIEKNLANIDSGVWMPTEMSWYTDPEKIKRWTQSPVHPPEYKTAVIDYALKATYPTPWFFLPTYSRIGDVLNPGLDPVWLGTKSAKDAIAEMMPKIRPIFESGKAN